MLTKQPSIAAMLSKQKAEQNERFNENARKNRQVFKIRDRMMMIGWHHGMIMNEYY